MNWADLNWSEYKTTFCEPTNCMLNYIISKGYCLDQFQKKYFTYNHFQNYSSMDMEEKYIGLKEISPESNQILYMSEISFNNINLELESTFSQSDFDNALSRFLLIKTENGLIFMKRGIYLTKKHSSFDMVITKSNGDVRQYNFNPHKGYMHCNLELVKIKNNYNENFIPIEQKKPNLIKPILTDTDEEIDINEETVVNKSLEAVEYRKVKKYGIVKEATNNLKKNYLNIREDIRQQEIINGWQD